MPPLLFVDLQQMINRGSFPRKKSVGVVQRDDLGRNNARIINDNHRGHYPDVSLTPVARGICMTSRELPRDSSSIPLLAGSINNRWQTQRLSKHRGKLPGKFNHRATSRPDKHRLPLANG